MGDVGTRRSTLVSKLPIFRRSITRRQESLPSSPSSNNTGGLHSSSPSSTNSSSGSTGKRRSIFRTPSLGFHHKKDNDTKFASSQVETISHNNLQNLELEKQTKNKARSPTGIPSSCRKKITRSVTEDFEKKKEHSVNRNVFTNCLGKSEGDDSGFIEDQSKQSLKHSTRRLLPRSFSSNYRFCKHRSQCQTPSSAQSLGCPDEVISPETGSLLAKPVLQSANEVTEYTENSLQSLQSPLISTDHTTAPQTPSDLIFMDDSASEADSLPVSVHQKSDKRPICNTLSTSQTFNSPASVADQVNVAEHMSECDGLMLSKAKSDQSVRIPGSNTSLESSKELIAMVELTTSNFSNPEAGTGEQHINKSVCHNGGHVNSVENLPKNSEPAVSQCEVMPISRVYHTMPETKGTMTSSETQPSYIQNGRARGFAANKINLDFLRIIINGVFELLPLATLGSLSSAQLGVENLSEEMGVRHSDVTSCPAEFVEDHGFNTVFAVGRTIKLIWQNLPADTDNLPQAALIESVNYASSFSPYRDGRHSERRLRSSSEGTAGGTRMAYKPKEQNSEELTHFRKPRTISTSSKMSSMDVLNNLGSCELDEDDLMLDLEFTEEQQLRRVCREDSYQSIVSCSAFVPSHTEQSSETTKLTEEASKIHQQATRNLYLHLPRENDQEDTKCPRICQVPTSPSVEWPFAQEDISSLESLSFRLMMQDCISVKTLLLKMKRILQESNEMSPASSTASLPISPIAERSHLFTDIMKDECSMLKLQLKERDERIHQLQEELKSVRTLQSLNVSKQDKFTQTEFINHEVINNQIRQHLANEVTDIIIFLQSFSAL
ncbi:serine-rich coiled-coil domain-containing protein 1 [Gastrophryne carolinensis]